MKCKLIFTVFFLIVNIAVKAQSYTNYDIILKTNGEEMEGNIKEMNADNVSFVYKNETFSYTVKKSNIVKITFSSGRIEFFNKFSTQGNSNNSNSSINTNANLEDHHNKVAILPFGYIKDQRDGSESMSNKIQTETYSLFNKNKIGLTFQSPRTTNALLIKSGVRNNNIQGYTMGEICHILGVEYVIQGVVSVEKTTQTSFASTNSTTKKKSNNAYVDWNGNIIGDIYGGGKKKTSSTTFATTTQNYATSMTLNIFNDRGDNIYSQDHTAFWNTQDAYKITLKYLAKRTPLFKK